MSDIVSSKSIGAKGTLVLTDVGKGSISEFRDTWINYESGYIAKDVLHAVNLILNIK